MIGYKQDYYASKDLNHESAAVAERYEIEKPAGIWYLPFLPAIRGLDGAKVALLLDHDGEADLNRRIENLSKEGKSLGDDKKTGNGLTFGAGVQFNVTPPLGLRAEWQRYRKLGGDSDMGDVDVISIGALWRFR